MDIKGRLWFISVIVSSVLALAETSKEDESITTDKNEVFTIYKTHDGSFYSSGCKEGLCQAKTQISVPTEFAKKLIRPPYHVNPGNEICQKIGGKSFKGYFKNHNEQTFCQFPDGSFVDTGTVFKLIRDQAEATNK
ncbi:MAG: DUF333 domain-containing protein [Bdellovibrionaceae bacterium]|nr:DUF333 domain-containing protein [Pseudobdellovibrionaceae bacterium]MDW8189707.1 hypothetical protein [Pseudobdellovibrionaceae bacterium]